MCEKMVRLNGGRIKYYGLASGSKTYKGKTLKYDNFNVISPCGP